MTGLEIKQEAERYIEEFIDDPDALVFINRCLNMIGDQAQIYETRKGDVTEVLEWIELPTTTTHIRKVEKPNGTPYYDYEVVDNRIRFRHPGTYYIHFRRLPKPLSGLLETPEVHQAFHSVLVTGLIALWKLKDDDENPDGVRQLELFMQLTQRVANSITRVRTPNKVRVIR